MRAPNLHRLDVEECNDALLEGRVPKSTLAASGRIRTVWRPQRSSRVAAQSAPPSLFLPPRRTVLQSDVGIAVQGSRPLRGRRSHLLAKARRRRRVDLQRADPLCTWVVSRCRRTRRGECAPSLTWKHGGGSCVRVWTRRTKQNHRICPKYFLSSSQRREICAGHEPLGPVESRLGRSLRSPG